MQMVLQLQIQAIAQAFAQPLCFAQRLQTAAEDDDPVAAPIQIIQPQTRIALTSAQLRAGDQLAEIGIPHFIFGKRHNAAAAFEGQLASDDRCELLL